MGAGIAVDAQGNAYVTGTTSSFNFPLVNALQTTHAGSQPDAFVAKISPSGTGLIYSTYLGGSGIDVANAIAVDVTGQAYVAGYTASSDFPATAAAETANSGGYDGFLVALSADGRQLTQSMCIGGGGNDAVNALAIVRGAAYVAGQTASLNFPVRNGIQLTTAGSIDAFIANFALPAYGVPAAAVFVKTDSTTQGSWKGRYGADGFGIANDSANYPAYATVSFNQGSATWVPSTSDVRALQKSAAMDRIASTWYAWSSFGIDLNLKDGQTHQVALYCLDWDSGNRTQTIEVLDADTPAILDRRTVSAFRGGQYLVWNLSGHVNIRITLAGGSNVVLSAMFFGGVPPNGQATAAYVKTDTTTLGAWKTMYGANGFAIANDSSNYPAYATVVFNQSTGTWSASTADARALQKSAATDRIASTWYAWSSFSIDLNLNDGQAHQVALYCLDWDSGNRAEVIEILDSATGAVLDSRTVSAFTGGQYLVWNLSGHINIRITLTGSSNAVVSGIFFGGPRSTLTASFVKTDTTTQGSWKGVYGANGYAIANDSANYPAFAQVNFNQSAATWMPSTADVRALQKSTASGRIASTWYAWSSFSIDLNLIDGQTHQVALYVLDWDSGNRAEAIEIIDVANSVVLDRRTVFGFTGGQYVAWNLSGHVSIRITLTGSSNAVLSGLFF
jgi:hypothetical protein